ncbi:MAG: choice-of-anchor Q domain-containing protein, partial [Dehalococcoidia bacterium]
MALVLGLGAWHAGAGLALGAPPAAPPLVQSDGIQAEPAAELPIVMIQVNESLRISDTPQFLPAVLIAVAESLNLDETVAATALSIDVNTFDDELNNDGDCSLREAIIAANTDAAVGACPAGNGTDLINLPAGTYKLTLAGAGENAAATGDLDITGDLIIDGAGRDATIIDGNGSVLGDRVLHITSDTIKVRLTGLTVQNGSNAGGSGAGILNIGALTATDIAVKNNAGTGIFSGSGNTAKNGSELTLTRGLIENNTGGPGGGGSGIQLAIPSLPTTITDSTIRGNSGAGIVNASTRTFFTASLTVHGSTVSGNNTQGIFLSAINSGTSKAVVVNSTISGNGFAGMELQPGGSSPIVATVINSTIVGSGAAGGFFGGNAFTTFTLKGSILDNDANGNCNTGAGVLTSLGYNISSDESCDAEFVETGDLTKTELLLDSLQDNGGETFTHALLTGSPGINHIPVADCTDPADNDNPLTADQRGVARPQGP